MASAALPGSVSGAVTLGRRPPRAGRNEGDLEGEGGPGDAAAHRFGPVALD
jgi:hypothetical protein